MNSTLDFYKQGGYFDAKHDGDIAHSPWKAGHIFRGLQHVGIAPNTVAEIGCGAGRILAELQRLMPPETSFHGYEVSPQMIAACAALQNEKLSFTLADDFASADSAHYDVAIAADVFEHVEDVFGFLRAMAKKADYAVFHIPLDMNLLNIVMPKRIMAMRRSIGHIHYFMKDTALALLTDCGFEVLHHHYTAAAIDHPSGSWRNALANPFRKALFRVAPDITARLLSGYAYLVVAKSTHGARA